MARQNLLVAAVNEALTRQLITLECVPFAPAAFEFTLGGYLIAAHVRDAGFDEVSVHVTAAPTEEGRRLISCALLHGRDRSRFGEATTFDWLERRTGKYLQSGVTYHGAKEITKALAALRVEPLGFGVEPTKGGYDFHREFESVFRTRSDLRGGL
jgi:hypothetical protein